MGCRSNFRAQTGSGIQSSETEMIGKLRLGWQSKGVQLAGTIKKKFNVKRIDLTVAIVFSRDETSV